mgnify:CR=1 FL=1
MQLNDVLANTDDRTFWKRYGHLGDEYMKARHKAEHAALDLAMLCEDEGIASFTTSTPMKFKKGGKFVAVGMWDVRYGVQFFAVDYETPEDRAEVDQWIQDFQTGVFA